MNQQTNLKLPSKGRPKGLFLFCNGCDTHYTDDRKIRCKCNRLVYKAIVHVSGTKSKTRPKVLQATDFKSALSEFIDFKDQVTANGFQKIEIKETVTNVPSRLIECFAYYIGFLNNEGVVAHKQKKREQKYINEVDRTFSQFQEALTNNGVDCSILKFTEVNDIMIGFLHDHLLKTLKLENKTYNNKMGLLSGFTSHIISTFELNYKNPFLGVPSRVVNVIVESVEENEFEQLLAIITPENGVAMKIIKTLKNPKKVTMYRPWLKHAYKFALFTGGRSEDIVLPQWKDIQLTVDGKFDTIKVVDHKIDSANNNLTSEKDRFFKYFAITKELAELLFEMGYEIYKGSEKYIIAPEDSVSRSFVSKLISESFTHYYKQLNTGKKVSFKEIRKAFMTEALKQYSDSSVALTNHSTISMTLKRYNNKKVTRDDAKENFSVFGKKS